MLASDAKLLTQELTKQSWYVDVHFEPLVDICRSVAPRRDSHSDTLLTAAQATDNG